MIGIPSRLTLKQEAVMAKVVREAVESAVQQG
jgi:hypothetical protein